MPGSTKPFLSVIIPAYNEEKRIPHTLLEVDQYLSRQKYQYEILVVNDGSKDNTASVVENFKKIVKNLSLVDNRENHGKGYVVRQGMISARGRYRLFMDADNSTTVDQVEKMFPFLQSRKEKYDIVIGSRAIKGSHIVRHQPFYKELLGKMGNIVIQTVAIWGIKDTQCGFKVFSEKSVKDIFPRMTIDRWGFDIEALVIGKGLGYNIKEVPVNWVNDPNSHVTLKGYIGVLMETLRIRLNVIMNKYKFSEQVEL